MYSRNISVLTDTEAPPGLGPRSHGPFSLREYQWETGNLWASIKEDQDGDVEVCGTATVK